MQICYRKMYRCLSAIIFTQFAYVFSYFFVCQYVLEVTIISSTTFLRSTTQVCNERAAHVVYISSAQLKENSSYRNFIGWFSREQPLLQETP